MMMPGLIPAPLLLSSYYVGNDESNGNNELDYFAFDYRGLIGFVQGLKGLGLASPKGLLLRSPEPSSAYLPYRSSTILL